MENIEGSRELEMSPEELQNSSSRNPVQPRIASRKPNRGPREGQRGPERFTRGPGEAQ